MFFRKRPIVFLWLSLFLAVAVSEHVIAHVKPVIWESTDLEEERLEEETRTKELLSEVLSGGNDDDTQTASAFLAASQAFGTGCISSVKVLLKAQNAWTCAPKRYYIMYCQLKFHL